MCEEGKKEEVIQKRQKTIGSTVTISRKAKDDKGSIEVSCPTAVFTAKDAETETAPENQIGKKITLKSPAAFHNMPGAYGKQKRSKENVFPMVRERGHIIQKEVE